MGRVVSRRSRRGDVAAPPSRGHPRDISSIAGTPFYSPRRARRGGSDRGGHMQDAILRGAGIPQLGWPRNFSGKAVSCLRLDSRDQRRRCSCATESRPRDGLWAGYALGLHPGSVPGTHSLVLLRRGENKRRSFGRKRRQGCTRRIRLLYRHGMPT